MTMRLWFSLRLPSVIEAEYGMRDRSNDKSRDVIRKAERMVWSAPPSTVALPKSYHVSTANMNDLTLFLLVHFCQRRPLARITRLNERGLSAAGETRVLSRVPTKLTRKSQIYQVSATGYDE